MSNAWLNTVESVKLDYKSKLKLKIKEQKYRNKFNSLSTS